MMKSPKLILIKDLLEPVAIAQRRVAKIISKGDDDGLDELFIHGLFILAVSSLECMMNDVLIYLLQAVPEKLAFQEVKVTKDEVFSSIFTRNIIIEQSEKEVVAASYKRFEEYVEYFCKVTAIGKDFTKEKINELREIR
ncbi:MAG: hypothetical protein ACREOB_03625, partial [Thermodesulfobacteriota bacterium]